LECLTQDAMITSSELDKIRPSYRTTLIIASENVPFSVSFPCRGDLDWFVSFIHQEIT